MLKKSNSIQESEDKPVYSLFVFVTASIVKENVILIKSSFQNTRFLT
jgi:hypothetical protein